MGLHIRRILLKAAPHNDHVGFWGIVLILHSGRAGNLALLQLVGDGPGQQNLFAQRLSQLLLGDVPGAQQHRLRAGNVDDRGLHAHFAGPAIQNQGQPAVHIRQHILCRGGAGAAGAIGRRRRKRQPGQFHQAVGHRVRGHTHSHGIQPGAHLIRQPGPSGQNHAQGAGPEGLRQLFSAGGDLLHHLLQDFMYI